MDMDNTSVTPLTPKDVVGKVFTEVKKTKLIQNINTALQYTSINEDHKLTANINVEKAKAGTQINLPSTILLQQIKQIYKEWNILLEYYNDTDFRGESYRSERFVFTSKESFFG